MKKLQLTLLLFLSILFSFGQSEGVKSLNKKCKEVRKYLEEKYNKEFISEDCDISVRYGNTIVSTVSYVSHPNRKFKVETLFNKGYKKILQVHENIENEFIAYATKEKAEKELGQILKGFDDFEIEYSPTDVSILLYGNMTQTNYSELKEALAFLSKEENSDLLMGMTVTSEKPKFLPQFYLNIVCSDADFSVFPLMNSERSGIEQSMALIMEKNGGGIDTVSQYNIMTETSSFKNENVIELLQRQLMAISKVDRTYKLSAGGYYFLRRDLENKEEQ